MNTPSRWLLALLALTSVVGLGYYAFLISSQTLTLPFPASDTQYGQKLEFVVSPPSLQFTRSDWPLLDTVALEAALTRGGVSLTPEILSWEYRISTGSAYFSITAEDRRKEDIPKTPLILSAEIYNEQKSTSYRLPRDIVFHETDVPSGLEFEEEGDPRDQTYNISLYGPGEYSAGDIAYYVHYETEADCQPSSWGAPLLYGGVRDEYLSRTPKGVSGEDLPMVNPLPILSTPWIYEPVFPEMLTPATKDGQRSVAQVRIPYDLAASRVCIIAGIGGQYRVIEDRILEPFTVTGSVLRALSPEYDMQTQIEFRFSHDVYRDQWALYSPEYISHRQDAKIAFLKSLQISPSVEVAPENLVLTPDRAILTLPLKEGEKYEFALKDIGDIYGRKAQVSFEETLQSEPFLSLRLTADKQIYTPTEKIDAKLYALLSGKNAYPLKMCRVNLETYARLERALLDTSRLTNTALSTLMLSTEVSECRDKEIVLSSSWYISPFRIDDFFPQGEKKTGMYVLSFSRGEDTEKYPKFISPIIFSIVDTHLTMKVDASGKITILATDIKTGNPLPDQEITLMRNISRTHTERWNPDTGEVERTYLPLTTQSFATGITIGRTDGEGYIDTKVDTLPGIEWYDANPYSLSFENWWEYEGRYDSFLVRSRSADRLGYLVSTWNDGITGYNFGIKEYDYSWSTRPVFTTYIHTDRKLYLPGEKVYIHAIMRANNASLEIPKDTPFDLIVTDSLWREQKRVTPKPNEFGSLFTEFNLPKDASLGSYSINISTNADSQYVENGWSNFQVEVFKNPTFTATVELKSPDLEGDAIRDLRKVSNTDPYNPWYKDVYTGEFTIEGIVKAKYYNGAEIKNTPFTYRVYRSDYYDASYWGDCFWGCYYEDSLEQYTDGSGMIDGDGYGIIRVPVEYTSFYSDYKYTIEVTLRDILTGEEVTTPGSLIVKLPESYKGFAPENPLTFTPRKKILSPGETLIGELKPLHGNWDKNLIGKYTYELIHREYKETFVDDIRAGTIRMTTPIDTVISTGSIIKKDFSDKLIWAKSGEYRLRISPQNDGEVPESSISETIFYISGDVMLLSGNALRVVPERTVYKLGETARVMIQAPFTGSHILITHEKWWVIDREYVYLTGNTLMREYLIDDTMIPNVYIGAVALRPGWSDTSSRTYAVGYGEIVTDMSDKKSLLSIVTDKAVYKNREKVNIDLTLTDRSGNPLYGEVTLMVVDESLIRLLGNIDLDIIPKFYQKYPFTVKTALSAIGIERNRFLSRKWSNGGSGNKWGEWAQISSRTIFENTAFYSPSIRTDASGKAKVSFTLPDNITDYRIIAIAGTIDSRFGVAEKTIEVRKDYVLEVASPMILRSGDTFTFTASAFNNTKRITPTDIVLRIGTGSSRLLFTGSLSLQVMERASRDFSVKVPTSWSGEVPYTIELREKDKILDSISRTFLVPTLPIVKPKIRAIEIFTGTNFTHKLPPLPSNTDNTLSKVEVRVASNYGDRINEGLNSLIQYPYGCIEQTIASTLPNRIALSLAENLGITIDRAKAQDYTKNGLEKILRMQHFNGWWVYWEWDTEAEPMITPYVLRSLQKFRDLGESIPATVFENGLNYIINEEAVYQRNMDTYAEAVWTLASLADSRAPIWWAKIDPKKLSRHGYIAYMYASQKLGKYSEEMESIYNSYNDSDSDSWYWSRFADDAIFAQLLQERGSRDKALTIIDPLIRSLDLSSYYVSTQEKIQTLLALTAFSKDQGKITKDMDIAFRSEWVITDLGLSPTRLSNSLAITREKMGGSYTLKRDASKIPLFVTTSIQDRPKEVTLEEAFSTGGIRVERKYEFIDESRWVDSRGEFIVRTPVENAIFHKWKLYKVTLTVSLPQGRSYRHVALEDFFPGWWRAINTTLLTERSDLETGASSSWWSHLESRQDRLLAYRDYYSPSLGEKLTYSYYIRPESAGDYLLPPATAYLMYRPEIHAYGRYERVKILPEK